MSDKIAPDLSMSFFKKLQKELLKPYSLDVVYVKKLSSKKSVNLLKDNQSIKEVTYERIN